MVPLVMLLILWGVLGLSGRFFFPALRSWRVSGRLALTGMFLFTGITHFSPMRHHYVVMIPEPLPKQLIIVYLTGLLEILGGIGLAYSRTARSAGACLMLLLVLLFPANINAAVDEIPFGGAPPTSLWLRLPIQVFFLAAIWWTSVRKEG
jgi:uncharacterized membrane protein